MNQKARFLQEFEKWLKNYLECAHQSKGKQESIDGAITSFRASMKANAEYHQNFAGNETEGNYHQTIASIYAVLATA